MAATLREQRQRQRPPPVEGLRRRLRRRLKYIAYGAVALIALVAAGRAVTHNPTCASEQATEGRWSFRAEQDPDGPLTVCYEAVPRQYIAGWDTTGAVSVTNTGEEPVAVDVDWRLRSNETLTDAAEPRVFAPGDRVEYSTALRVGSDGPTEMRVRVYADGDRVYRAFARADTRGLLEAYLGWLVVAAALIGLAIWVLLGRDHNPPEYMDEDVQAPGPRAGNYVWPRA